MLLRLILRWIQPVLMTVCRHREDTVDTEERDNLRLGLLGDGPTLNRRFQPAYDDDYDDEAYYDETEATYDDGDEDAGHNADDDDYTDGNTANTDIGQILYCTGARFLKHHKKILEHFRNFIDLQTS